MPKNINVFQIDDDNYTTREYCQCQGITDNKQILKIQWHINHYLRTHTTYNATKELKRIVQNVKQTEPTHHTLIDHNTGAIPPLIVGGAGIPTYTVQLDQTAEDTRNTKAVTRTIVIRYADAIRNVNRIQGQIAQLEKELLIAQQDTESCHKELTYSLKS